MVFVNLHIFDLCKSEEATLIFVIKRSNLLPFTVDLDRRARSLESSVIPVYVLYLLVLVDVTLSLLCVCTFVAKTEQVFGLNVLLQALGKILRFRHLFELDSKQFSCSLTAAVSTEHLISEILITILIALTTYM